MMKKKCVIVAAMAVMLLMTSCLGSFALTSKVMRWNRGVSERKWVNEVVYAAFWIIPVYEITALTDLLVMNTIEFWSDRNPVVEETVMIDGRDARYRIDTHSGGYIVTNLSNGDVTRLNFDNASRTWSVTTPDGEVPFLTWIDDTHISVPATDGSWRVVTPDDETPLYALR